MRKDGGLSKDGVQKAVQGSSRSVPGKPQDVRNFPSGKYGVQVQAPGKSRLGASATMLGALDERTVLRRALVTTVS